MTLNRNSFRIRRSLLVASAAMTVGLLAGCSSASGSGGSSSGSAAGSSSAAAAKKASDVHLALQLLFAGVSFSNSTSNGAKQAAKESGVNLSVNATPTLDPAAATAQVENSLSSGVDGIGVGDEPASLWTRTLNDAVTHTKGNAIAFNSVPDPATTVKTYVGVNSAELGRRQVDETLKAAKLDPNTTGSVLLGQCVPQSNPLTSQLKAMGAEIQKLLPKAKVLPIFNSQVVPAQNFTAWEQAVQANKGIVLTMGACDQDGDSMVKARKTSGGHFAIGASNTDPAVIQGLKDGSVSAVVGGNFYLVGYTVTRMLGEAATKATAPPAGWFDTGEFVFTKANADEATARDASAAGEAAYNAPLIKSYWSKIDSAAKTFAEMRAN